MQQTPFGQKLDERVGDSGPVTAWIELRGQRIEWLGVPSEVADVENGFRVGKS